MFYYDIYKKFDSYVAVFTNINSQLERWHYETQGFIYLGNFFAGNANLAIEFARQQDFSIIGTLNSKIEELTRENKKLRQDLSDANLSQQQTKVNPFTDDPLKVLGLEAGANKDEIRKKCRILAQRLHRDKNGSDYLMSVVNSARDRLQVKAD